MNLTVLAITAAVALAGQPDTLNVVKVTARRGLSASSSSPVQTVSALAIERSGAAGMNEVLRGLSGVNVKDYGGVGGLKTVSVRGLGTQHTSVCVDGFQVSDAQNGQIDISRFSLEDVASLSMMVGQSDDIFRPARTMTSSGVLSIESSAPHFVEDRAVRVSARMRAGSFHTYNPYVRVDGRLSGRWTTSISSEWIKSDGVYPFTMTNGGTTFTEKRLNSDVRVFNTNLNLFGDLGRAGSIRGKVSWYDSERGLPGSVVFYTQNPTERLWDRNLNANLRFDARPLDALRLRVSGSYADSRNRYVNTSALYQEPEVDNYCQREYSLSAIAMYSVGKHVNVAFAEDLAYNTLDSDIPESQFPTRVSSVSALTAQYACDRLTATAGLSHTASRETVRTGAAAPDRSRLSPFASLSMEILDGLRARASYVDGFRLPTFNDLYYARVGNRNIRPEKARQLNAGLTYAHGSLVLTADAYSNRVEDKIVAIPTMFVWKMQNVGKVQMYGVDLTASGALLVIGEATLRGRANYSFAYAVDITDPESKTYRNQVQYTPRHSGNMALSLETSWVNVAYSLNAVGQRYFLAQNVKANRMPAYFDHSVSLNRSWTVRGTVLRLSAEALNLGNVNYEIVRFYPMPGRNYRLTLKISY